MKVKELIEELQKLNCDEKEVVIDWQESVNKYISNKHDDYIEINFGLTFIPTGIYVDHYNSATSEVFIDVKLEAEVSIK